MESLSFQNSPVKENDFETLKAIAEDIKEVINLGVQVCVVVGGGNIYRGIDASILGMERAAADYMGMLATMINSMALQSALESAHVPTRLQSGRPRDAAGRKSALACRRARPPR